MKPNKSVFVALVSFAISLAISLTISLTTACSERPKAPDIANDIRHALDQAGLNEVSVSQDREKSVVTLTGKVATDDDKGRAESIARSIAGAQVVSNEIGVRPAGEEGTAKKIDSDVDSGIDKNLEAMLLQHNLKRDVNYDVINDVVTLKGDVASQTQRASVEKLAERVPNVKQVVNELEVKHQRATSSK